MSDQTRTLEMILAGRRSLPGSRALLVGVTGIDGSGKGFVTQRLVAGLLADGIHAVGISIDPWLNLPAKRFNAASPAEHFYHHAIRFDELFATLVRPLRDRRSLLVEADLTEETADEYHRTTLQYDDVDVIFLEGIFLLKRPYREDFDLSFWINCTFATALERAIARGQEGLPPAETIRAYETIYFPAQRHHFAADEPERAANAVLVNDLRLGSVW